MYITVCSLYMYELLYCNVCIFVLHVVVVCMETVLLYAGLCHHHGLPRVQVPHISAAKHACTPSEDIVYPVVTRAHPTTRYTIFSDQYLRDSISVRQLCYIFLPYNHGLCMYNYMCICVPIVYMILCVYTYTYICTITIIIESYIYIQQ